MAYDDEQYYDSDPGLARAWPVASQLDPGSGLLSCSDSASWSDHDSLVGNPIENVGLIPRATKGIALVKFQELLDHWKLKHQ